LRRPRHVQHGIILKGWTGGEAKQIAREETINEIGQTLAYSASVHQSVGNIQYHLMFNRKAILLFDAALKLDQCSGLTYRELIKQIAETEQLARENLQGAQKSQSLL